MKGIKFGNIHSYDDLNLILSSVKIPPAPVKTNYIDIPYADGSVDMTEALGAVRYGNRECSFTFTAFPSDDWEAKKTEVSNLLNGQRCRIILDKDSEYYWDGRCSVNDYESDRNLHKIVIGATVAPYKLKHDQTQVTVPAGDSVAVALTNGRRSIIPTITCTAQAEVEFNGNTYTFNAGTHRSLGIVLVEGDNHLTVTSTDDVVFTYQEGDL